MVSPQSDSSDDERGEYTSTNVLIGYAEDQPTDDTFSRLGGIPVSCIGSVVRGFMIDTNIGLARCRNSSICGVRQVQSLPQHDGTSAAA